MTSRRARLDGGHRGQSVRARGRRAFLDHRQRPAQVNVGWGEHREPQLSFFYIASITSYPQIIDSDFVGVHFIHPNLRASFL